MDNKRILRLSCLIILILCLLCACSREKDSTEVISPSECPSCPPEEITASPEPTDVPYVSDTPVITPTAEPTETPTEIPTEILTEIPTPSPTPKNKYGTPEKLAKNRELHSKLKGSLEYSDAGTGKGPTENVSLDLKYGITRDNPEITTKILNGNKYNNGVHICGLKDKEVTKKINDRIDEVIEIFYDPEYYTDVAGIIPFMKEHGPGSREIKMVEEYNSNHLISFRITLKTRWDWGEKYKASDIPDYDGDGSIRRDEVEKYFYGEIREGYEQASGGIRYDIYSMSPKGYHPEDDTYRYNVIAYTYEEKGLTFNLETGEELRLSDFFAEGEDYLKYISDMEYEENVKYSFSVFDYYENYRENYDPDEHYSDYKEYMEYDGGSLYQGINPDKEFYIGYWGELYLIDNELYDYDYGIELEQPLYSMVNFRDIFEEEERVNLSPLNKYSFYVYAWESYLDYDPYYEDDYPYSSGYKTIAEFNTESIEGEDVSVTIRKPRRQDQESINISDKEHVKLLKDYLNTTGFKFHSGECYMAIYEVSEYPNGYIRYNWKGKNKPYTTDENGERDRLYIEINQWVKDGKTVAPEDMIDIPMEEMLEILFSKLSGKQRKPDYTYTFTDEKLNEEEIQRTVKILSSHVMGFDPDDNMRPVFDFEYYAEYDRYSEDSLKYLPHGMISEEEVKQLPELVIRRLMGRYDNDFIATYKNYFKHFKIYEGYEF